MVAPSSISHLTIAAKILSNICMYDLGRAFKPSETSSMHVACVTGILIVDYLSACVLTNP
jgi:hypothetical protein